MEDEPQGVFSFEAKDINDKVVHLDSFIGKALLIVNTASKGAEKYELNLLQDLYNKYKDKGVEVLAFPCRQFLKRETKDPEKLRKKYIERGNYSFHVFGLTKVNGERAIPLFKWLKRFSRGLHGSAIEWNYTKFFVKDDGKTIFRFSSTEKYENIKKVIDANLPLQYTNVPPSLSEAKNETIETEQEENEEPQKENKETRKEEEKIE